MNGDEMYHSNFQKVFIISDSDANIINYKILKLLDIYLENDSVSTRNEHPLIRDKLPLTFIMEVPK